MHGRLPWLEPENLTDPQRRVYDAVARGPRAAGPRAFALMDERERLEGPFNAMLFAPEIGSALAALGEAIRFRGTLSHREREIAILAVAAAAHSAFEWYAHERVGRAAGLTDDELDAVQAGAPGATFTGRERAVHAAVIELIAARDLDDDAYAAARAQLDDGALSELVTLVGYYQLLALSLRVFRTPLPPGARTPYR